MKELLRNRLVLVLGHFALGYALTFSLIPKLFGLAVLIIGSFYIINNKNRNQEALLAASYLVGAEVLIRMTGGYILYETGKYGVALFLLLGLIVGNNKFKPNVIFIFYVLLLMLGIVFTYVPEGQSIRNEIVFNLSGPILLGFCAFYFYKREFHLEKILEGLFFMLLPVLAMTSYLYFRTPDLEEIVFGTAANFDTSGGFGPNQVATILGLGIYATALLILFKKKLSGFLLFDVFIFVYIVYRGFLTFSRGGIITAVIALISFLIFYSISIKDGKKFILRVSVISVFMFVGIWLYTSNITGGMLDNRYAGKNARGIQKKDISSGRIAILEEQLASFYESPITGIGVGNGKYKRKFASKKVTAASHNELGRLIEEHGIIGLFSMVILFILPSQMFIRKSNLERAFLVSYFLFWLLTISHSAMRVAFPSFIFGLCLINLIPNKSSE